MGTKVGGGRFSRSLVRPSDLRSHRAWPGGPAVPLFRRSGGEETDEDRGERRNRQDEGTPDQADFFLQHRHLDLEGSQLPLNRPEGFLDRRQFRRSDLTVVNSDFRFVSTSPIPVATA